MRDHRSVDHRLRALQHSPGCRVRVLDELPGVSHNISQRGQRRRRASERRCMRFRCVSRCDGRVRFIKRRPPGLQVARDVSRLGRPDLWRRVLGLVVWCDRRPPVRGIAGSAFVPEGHGTPTSDTSAMPGLSANRVAGCAPNACDARTLARIGCTICSILRDTPADPSTSLDEFHQGVRRLTAISTLPPLRRVRPACAQSPVKRAGPSRRRPRRAAPRLVHRRTRRRSPRSTSDRRRRAARTQTRRAGGGWSRRGRRR